VIDPGLRGRVALVTGANQGIGAAAAGALVAQGAAVFVTALRLGPDDPGVQAMAPTVRAADYATARTRAPEDVARALRAAGGRAAAWEADLADPATPAALFDRAEAALGPRLGGDARPHLCRQQPGRRPPDRRVRSPAPGAGRHLGAHRLPHHRRGAGFPAGRLLRGEQERSPSG
jgi:NAD(P)-dependent dehydrogenase (short-subunit alcohol dehydrogenase family)